MGDRGSTCRKRIQSESRYCLDLQRPAGPILHAAYDIEGGFAAPIIRSMLKVTDGLDARVRDKADFFPQLTQNGRTRILVCFPPTTWKSPALGVAQSDEDNLPLRRERNAVHAQCSGPRDKPDASSQSLEGVHAEMQNTA